MWQYRQKFSPRCSRRESIPHEQMNDTQERQYAGNHDVHAYRSKNFERSNVFQPSTNPRNYAYNDLKHSHTALLCDVEASYVDQYDERVKHKHRNQANFEKWYQEDPDWLFRCICPADLCDMPCLWDEIGGCQMFRLCHIRSKYPHPLHGMRPACNEYTKPTCDGIHEIIEPSCRSLGKQVADIDSANWQFSDYQTCKSVSRLASSDLKDPGIHCRWGHDYEAARIVALWAYGLHTAAASQAGARRRIERRDDIVVWKPLKPDLGTLHDLKVHSNGTVEGYTFHDRKIVLTWSMYHEFLARRQARLLALEAASSEQTDNASAEDKAMFRYEECPVGLRRAVSCSDLHAFSNTISIVKLRRHSAVTIYV